jgi:hypothetical protein
MEVVRQDGHRNHGRAGIGKEPARCQLSGCQRTLPAAALGSVSILDEAAILHAGAYPLG